MNHSSEFYRMTSEKLEAIMQNKNFSTLKKRIEAIGLEMRLLDEQFPLDQLQALLPTKSPIGQLHSCRSSFRTNIFFPSQIQSQTTDLAPEEVFEELGFIGSGSGGEVIKMRHIPSGTICAVKRMRLKDNEEENKRIATDLEVIAQCKNDNIVRCLGYFIDKSNVWICMELMKTSLDKLYKIQPLDEELLANIAYSSIKALHYLKTHHNIIHCDVKPSNILLDDKGVVKLCDFGSSSHYNRHDKQPGTSGCIYYMAPERIKPNSDYDERADVWSLGITLYELATGTLPYDTNLDEFLLLATILGLDAPRLPEEAEFSKEFRDFIAICLTSDYRQRPGYDKLIEHKFVARHK